MIYESIRCAAGIFGKTKWSSEIPFKVFYILKWIWQFKVVFLTHVIIFLLICQHPREWFSHEIYPRYHNLSQLQSRTKIITRNPPWGEMVCRCLSLCVSVCPCVSECAALLPWCLLCFPSSRMKTKTKHYFITTGCHEYNKKIFTK